MKEGWELKKLKEVCRLVNGRAYKKAELLSDGKYPVLRVGNLFTNKQWYYSNLELDEDKYCDKGDLIYAWSASFGPRIWNGKKVIYHYHIWKVLPDLDLITRDFLFHLFEWDKEMIKSAHGTGTTMMHVGKTSMENRIVPIPPLTEQKQIVTILDKAFAAIDQAKANIEQNIQNAQELFQSKLNEIFSQKGDGWEDKTLGEVCVVERGSSPRPIKKYLTDSEEGVNWIKIGDVPENDKYVKSTKQKITKEGAKKSRFVDVGDFILSNSMSFGRPYIMAIQGYIHDGWFVLRLPDCLNPDYFWQLLASPYIKEQFNSLAAGAIVKNISGDLVKKALIPIPPIEDQKNIFHETEKLKDQINLIINKYHLKAENLEELKKSILQKAFAGELTR